jgi:hypothetical protein
LPVISTYICTGNRSGSLELYRIALASEVSGSWVHPAERTAEAVDPMNLIQIMLAKGMENSQLNVGSPKRRE